MQNDEYNSSNTVTPVGFRSEHKQIFKFKMTYLKILDEGKAVTLQFATL